eukprot:3115860-Amphidinium_carterae.1
MGCCIPCSYVDACMAFQYAEVMAMPDGKLRASSMEMSVLEPDRIFNSNLPLLAKWIVRTVVTDENRFIVDDAFSVTAGVVGSAASDTQTFIPAPWTKSE